MWVKSIRQSNYSREIRYVEDESMSKFYWVVKWDNLYLRKNKNGTWSFRANKRRRREFKTRSRAENARIYTLFENVSVVRVRRRQFAYEAFVHKGRQLSTVGLYPTRRSAFAVLRALTKDQRSARSLGQLKLVEYIRTYRLLQDNPDLKLWRISVDVRKVDDEEHRSLPRTSSPYRKGQWEDQR